jgi:branched-chain amino acid transport system substrate-binding protein
MSRSHLKRSAAVVAGATVAAVALAACGGSGSTASGGSKGDIKVAQISSISGGYPFGDTVKGTQSYFNMVNAQGGINGRKVAFQSGDDKGQASEASQLARKFVLQNGVTAFVGSTSLADCDANKNFYTSKGVAVIGGGTEPSCFNQPNWMAVNSGPYIGHMVQWNYLFNTIKPTSVCEIEQNDSTSIKPYDTLRAAFKQQNPNAKFTAITYTNDASQNPTPAVTAAKQKGCDVITLSTVAPNMVAFRKAEKSVGLDATLVNLGSGYDTTVPATLGALGEAGALGPKDKGVFVGAELADVNADVPQIKAMMAQFDKDSTPANFWSEIGWLSAAVFADGLKQNKAPNADLGTAKGVLAELKAMSPYDSGFAVSPLAFGPDSTHQPNTGAQMLEIKDGKWAVSPGQNDGDFMKVSALPALDS